MGLIFLSEVEFLLTCAQRLCDKWVKVKVKVPSKTGPFETFQTNIPIKDNGASVSFLCILLCNDKSNLIGHERSLKSKQDWYITLILYEPKCRDSCVYKNS